MRIYRRVVAGCDIHPCSIVSLSWAVAEVCAFMGSKTKFNYEIIDLIECVESYPSLWDKACEDYKNKRMKETGWQQVCEFLEKNYKSMDSAQQKPIGKINRKRFWKL